LEQHDDSRLQKQDLEVNRCIKTLTGDSSWKGPATAFARDFQGDPVDLRAPLFSKTLSAFRDVVGVRINCDGVMKVQNAPRFETVTIKS